MTLPSWLKLVSGDMNDDAGEVTMMIHAPIGKTGNGDGISARTFGQSLAAIPVKKKITLDINTLGGKVDDGIAMHNMVAARGGITTRVVGYAASMGAIIHQAGAVRKMMPGTMLVIHNPQAVTEGDHRDMSKGAEFLKKVKDSLADILAKRSGQKPEKVSAMMDETTAMTAEDAKKLGFCDEVCEGSPAFNEMKPIELFDFLKTVRNGAAGSGPATQESKDADDASENAENDLQSDQKPNDMKLILAAVGKLGIKFPENITDELAAPQVETSLTALVTERDNLKSQVTTLTNAQKVRVEGKVKLAITNKLVKPEREAALVAQGLRDEAELDSTLTDLIEARGAAPATRRAAPPVPSASGSADEDKAVSLRAELADATPERKTVIARELRSLRGHKDMFAASAK